ncbi:hypothetical protein PMI42_07776 [Bradyrhizobium sp. YR681]|uniref:hypothetical protein n=1 Tax=Bradyrhizobium sp. YR681 TaxID=1144344 RepID=UPI00026FB1B5|nr:hypothetical protein [Bradyrhizobium sp. YR681]EJN07494.1 hypothetical protein PMI42_07776 [Bradyrhizobium sp. YR681]
MAETATQTTPLLFDDLPVADLGTISIRVFVLPPKPKKGTEKQTVLPLDVEEGEEFMLDDKGATPLSSYLEAGRGKRCVVYLVNGQRQEFDDNGFIVQDLGFRYLRARMMIMIDVDGLAPEALGKLMQGSRQGFYRGAVREALTRRIIATLKSDPDLERLEQEAEEAVSELSAGDEKVKQTLDQLIDAHHDKGHSFVDGIGSAGDVHSGDELGFKTVNKGGVVTLLPPSVGVGADYPVLTSQPAASIIRLRPNQPREIAIKSIPSGHWAAVSQLIVEGDSKVLELNVKHEKLDDHGKLILNFNADQNFDADEFPVRATVKITARFNGIVEPRRLELSVLTRPDVPSVDPKLVEDPVKLKVTSRQPVNIRLGDTDTHVKLRWDGKDKLVTDDDPKWRLSAKLLGKGAQPEMNFADPVAGRFSLLVSPRPEWQVGERLTFEVTASGPRGRQLFTSFDANVVEAPEPIEKDEKAPRLVEDEFKTGTMRRPPYELKTISRDEYQQQCWNEDEWTDEDAGAFVRPTERAPLILIINQDMAALRDFRQALAKRNTEQDVQRKLNKYTSHIAFHLYQMYQATIGKKDDDVDAADKARRSEVRRVALTMIKLMDVAEK